jgi:hypothetical protein
MDNDEQCDVESSSVPLMRSEDSAWVAHAERALFLADWFRRLAVMLMVVFSLALCIIFYFYCQNCLFFVVLVSACTCPFFHLMNLPLWVAIVLIAVGGGTMSVGYLSVSWTSKMF